MSLGSNIILPNVRRFYTPDPGYIIWDVDLAGADAQIVAWEANDLPLKKAFLDYQAGIGMKVHCVNAIAIFGEQKAGANGKTDPYYSRAKAGVHLCVADGHEALTPFGWLPVQTIPTNIPILICEPDGGSARWEIPSDWYHARHEGEMLHLTGAAYEQLVTLNHKMPYFVDQTVRACEAQYLPRSSRLPKTVLYSGPRSVNPFQLRLLAAFHADGSINKKQVRFHFKKQRKIERLCWILEQLRVAYDLHPYTDGSTNIVLRGNCPHTDWLISSGKAPTLELLQYSAEGLDAYIEELPLWDGHQARTSQSFSTAIATTADVVHTLLHLRGRSGTNNKKSERNHVVQINNRPLSRLQEKTIVNYTGGVHCPTVSTGFWFTRYNGRCAVTGNTNYGGKPATCSSALKISLAEATHFQRMWFQLHPAIAEWHERVLHDLHTTRSVTNKFGFTRRYFDRLDNLLPEALAWVPQSTVAIVINTAYNRITRELPTSQILLQVHDSLVGQTPIHEWKATKPLLRSLLNVTIPYDDPLVIPTGLKTSTVSWGDCKDEAWDD